MANSGKQKTIDDLVARIKARQDSRPEISELYRKLSEGDRHALSSAITLVESRLHSDIASSHDLLRLCLKSPGKSRRIAITGTPGAGKSTFINAYTQLLIEQGHKVAILSIDPSSSLSMGSILGDKTRMMDISGLKEVYIRPSAAGENLGGVHRRTREAIILCEAAGFDHILVETVGVGQSEHTVRSMTDMLLLLMLPGGGDELQGIKRGIMEMADAILIHKSDLYDEKQVGQALGDFRQSVQYLSNISTDWTVPVIRSSAFNREMLDEAAAMVNDFFSRMSANDSIAERRKTQWRQWFLDSLGWAVQEILTQKRADLAGYYPDPEDLPPAKALDMVERLFRNV